jgi:SpoIID/LytB domain protein
MNEKHEEPVIKVGLISGGGRVRFELSGEFQTETGERIEAGEYTASLIGDIVEVSGPKIFSAAKLQLSPSDFETCKFIIHDVVIGINFHWERKETQTFQGSLSVINEKNSLTVINELPLEAYLVSVISSEMNANCPPELLRAHAIVSRSWLLAQLNQAERIAEQNSLPQSGGVSDSREESMEIIKWYDRESHSAFDVCADDHCQRYQGISKLFSEEAIRAVEDTRGKVLFFEGEICDARYSKSCGGMSEVYRAAWEDKEVPYLTAVYDWLGEKENYPMPLSEELNAARWINSEPRAFCNTRSKDLLSRILPGFDQETVDFYRWRVRYSQAEIQELLRSRTGIDFGNIVALEPVERGESGRIIRLKITGTKQVKVIGKELEIRRALSPSHLYSSAFVVRVEKNGDLPESFELVGAGWGHGVGLCQIGAAVMADSGLTHDVILSHYFKHTELTTFY